MQLIEVSSFAMRSAVVRLRRSGTPLEFVLFPMIHQATPAFYAEIMARLGHCQLIVAEGVGKTAVVQALTLVYRLSGRAGRWGLVPQRLALADLGVPVLCPDMSADQFRREGSVRAHLLHTGPEVIRQTGGAFDAFCDFAGTGG